MRFRILFYILLGIAVLSCKDLPKEKQSTTENSPLKIEDVAVTSSFTDVEGNPIELEDYKGKRLFLNYWATWCRPCIEEMPDLLKLQAILIEENYIFLLASDESIKKIEQFKLDREFDFRFIKYNGTYGALDINALPVTFIYNEVGEQVFRFDGAMNWNTEEVINKLKNLN